MGTIVLTVKDDSLLSKIKSICLMLKGVDDVKIVHDENVCDITQTEGYKNAMEDIRMGRVYHADSVEDMFHQILSDVQH